MPHKFSIVKQNQRVFLSLAKKYRHEVKDEAYSTLKFTLISTP